MVNGFRESLLWRDGGSVWPVVVPLFRFGRGVRSSRGFAVLGGGQTEWRWGVGSFALSRYAQVSAVTQGRSKRYKKGEPFRIPLEISN